MQNWTVVWSEELWSLKFQLQSTHLRVNQDYDDDWSREVKAIKTVVYIIRPGSVLPLKKKYVHTLRKKNISALGDELLLLGTKRKKMCKKTLYQIPWLKRYWTFLIEEEEDRLQQKRKIPFLSQQWASFGVSQHDIITSVNLTCMPNKVSAQRAYRDLLCAAHEPHKFFSYFYFSSSSRRQFGPLLMCKKTLFRPIPFRTLGLQNWDLGRVGE